MRSQVTIAFPSYFRSSAFIPQMTGARLFFSFLIAVSISSDVGGPVSMLALGTALAASVCRRISGVCVCVCGGGGVLGYSSAVFPALLAVSASSATLLYHEFSSRPSSCLRLRASCLAVVLSPERRALRCSSMIARVLAISISTLI